MQIPVSKHRLRSSAFQRPDEKQKVEPKKVIFLSVEGDQTELKYFQYLDEVLDNSILKIEVLRHKRGDGYSDPTYVIDLLKEYIAVREGELIPEEINSDFISKYSKEKIDSYLSDGENLTKKEKHCIGEDLLLLGIDLEYRRYLQTYKNELDIFAVLLDRDCGNHSRELMEKCVKRCQENQYGCFITNPCFEFWLLLHLCDVKEEFTEEQQKELLENATVSGRHTKVSYEVSLRANHGKTIGKTKFKEHYLPNISRAIENAKRFAMDYPVLYDELGSNLPQLFTMIGYPLNMKIE